MLECLFRMCVGEVELSIIHRYLPTKYSFESGDFWSSKTGGAMNMIVPDGVDGRLQV